MKAKSCTGRILVTGGAGFIGANLVRMLLQHGYAVTVLDNLSTGRREYLDRLSVEFVQGDILDIGIINQLVPGNDGIVHLAAHTGVPGSLVDPRYDCEVNVIGTLNLLEACRVEKGRRHDAGSETAAQPGDSRPIRPNANGNPSGPKFVFASSNAPMGRQVPPATEDKAPLPVSPYGASKLAGEAYCLAYHGSWGLDTVVFRFGNVYGPFSAHKSSVVPRFFKDIMAKGRIIIDGDGQQTRDFIYVLDLCRAILLSLQSEVSGEVFQVAVGKRTSILELAALMREVVRRDVGIEHGPPRLGDIRQNYSVIAKLRKTMGWEPRTRLMDGLQLTYEWFGSKAGLHMT